VQSLRHPYDRAVIVSENWDRRDYPIMLAQLERVVPRENLTGMAKATRKRIFLS